MYVDILVDTRRGVYWVRGRYAYDHVLKHCPECDVRCVASNDAWMRLLEDAGPGWELHDVWTWDPEQRILISDKGLTILSKER